MTLYINEFGHFVFDALSEFGHHVFNNTLDEFGHHVFTPDAGPGPGPSGAGGWLRRRRR